MNNNTKFIDTATGKRVGSIGLIVLSLVFLLNPVVRVVDILPDFIACAIIVRLLYYVADRAPFFEEARADFLKLGFVSLAKIPAFFIISIARNSNTLDNDTTVLFTFVFSKIFFPSRRIVPSSGRRIPAAIRRKVLLPAPLVPMIP